MNENDLSPGARKRLAELTPSMDSVENENWSIAYFHMLKVLAEEDIPPLEEVEKKNDGIDALRKSRGDHAAAVELKNFAQAFVGIDISKAVAKLPDYADLDAFLESIMKDTGHKVRRNRFMDFLRDEASKQLANDPPPPGLGLEEDATSRWIESQACARFEALARETVPALAAYDIKEKYRVWWNRQKEGNNLAERNNEEKVTVQVRRSELIKLLPQRTNSEGMTKVEWRRRAKAKDLFTSLETFNRDVREIVGAGMIQKQENGNYRQHRK